MKSNLIVIDLGTSCHAFACDTPAPHIKIRDEVSKESDRHDLTIIFPKGCDADRVKMIADLINDTIAGLYQDEKTDVRSTTDGMAHQCSVGGAR